MQQQCKRCAETVEQKLKGILCSATEKINFLSPKKKTFALDHPFTLVCDYFAAAELETKHLCEYQKQREREKKQQDPSEKIQKN